MNISIKLLLPIFISLSGLNISCGSSIAKEKNLQGFWSCRKVEIDPTKIIDTIPNMDENVKTIETILGTTNWLVKGDSIWEFQYPCEYYNAFSFKIQGDSLYFDGEKIASRYFEFKNGELVVADAKITNHYEIDYFERDTFDIKTIELLKHDSVNMDCLTGRMEITKPLYNGKDGPSYDSTFPVAMPKYIDIQSKEQATVICRKRTITLSINGTEKLFYVEKIEWNNYNGDYATAFNDHFQHKHVITIHPAEWWKGTMFSVSYAEE